MSSLSYEDIKLSDLDDYVDQELYVLTLSYSYINLGFTNEINSKGGNFDYKSQESYQGHYDGPLLKFRLKEIITQKIDISNRRKVIVEELHYHLQYNTFIYEQFNSFFESLDRNAIMVDKYRKKFNKGANYTNKELEKELLFLTEIQDRDIYYKSNFFQEIGFLKLDYHKVIYENSKHLLMHLKDFFTGYEPIKSFYPKIYEETFVDMYAASYIFSQFNDIIFKNKSEYEFYRDINLKAVVSSTQILDNQANKMYFLLHNIEQHLITQSLKLQWRENMLQSLGIDKSTYKSKYRFIVGSDSTIEDNSWAVKISSFIEKIKEKPEII
jgi:hypothetical protein